MRLTLLYNAQAALAPQPAQDAPPCLATKSMGVLGRGEESGPGAQLPPLPRGSGVAQRLRSIRCAPGLRTRRLLV